MLVEMVAEVLGCCGAAVFCALRRLVVAVVLVSAWGCGVPRTTWDFNRALLDVDALADDGAFMEAREGYLALAPLAEREDLLRYVRFRAAYMLERAGDLRGALRGYEAIYGSPSGLYDHEAGQALYRTALILRDELGEGEESARVLEAVIRTFPNSNAADDALFALLDYRRERGEVGELLAFLSGVYAGLRYTEIADALVYWTGRLLQDERGDCVAASEVYALLITRFHPSGYADDALWRTGVCHREAGRLDEEYGLLKAFVDTREVSWFMADYESEYYRPALFRMAEIHEERGEYVEAIAVYERFQRMYPLSLLRDDTQYTIMELQRRIGDEAGLRRSLAWLESEYPESRFVERGRSLLTEALD